MTNRDNLILGRCTDFHIPQPKVKSNMKFIQRRLIFCKGLKFQMSQRAPRPNNTKQHLDSPTCPPPSSVEEPQPQDRFAQHQGSLLRPPTHLFRMCRRPFTNGLDSGMLEENLRKPRSGLTFPLGFQAHEYRAKSSERLQPLYHRAAAGV